MRIVNRHRSIWLVAAFGVASAVLLGPAFAAGSAGKPTISSFSPTNAKPSASVTVKGTNLTKVKSVKIAGVTAKFKAVSALKLVVTVPAAAKSGKIVVVTAAGSATSAGALVVAAAATASGSPSVAAGKGLFAANCSSCHGANGLGGNGGPDLQDEPLAKTVAGVTKQVTNGGGGMPAFGSQFTKAQIADLAAYVTQKIVGVSATP